LQTIKEALRTIADDWKALLSALGWPTLGLIAISLLTELNPEFAEFLFPNSSRFLHAFLQVFLPSVLQLVFLTLIGVSLHRLVILGAHALPDPAGIFWSARETRFLGWILAISIMTTAIYVITYRLVGIVPACSASGVGFTAAGCTRVWFLGSLALQLYFAARVSLVLPATAIDQRPSVRDSWRLSRSNGWRLATVALLPATAPFTLAFLPLGVVFFFPVLAVGILIGMASLPTAFCWFTAGDGPQTSS